MKVDELVWNNLPCCVQIWNLPLGYVDAEIGRAIGAHIGEVIEVDRRSIEQERGRYLRVKYVALNRNGGDILEEQHLHSRKKDYGRESFNAREVVRVDMEGVRWRQQESVEGEASSTRSVGIVIWDERVEKVLGYESTRGEMELAMERSMERSEHTSNELSTRELGFGQQIHAKTSHKQRQGIGTKARLIELDDHALVEERALAIFMKWWSKKTSQSEGGDFNGRKRDCIDARGMARDGDEVRLTALGKVRNEEVMETSRGKFFYCKGGGSRPKPALKS
ncbi:hypothetical protein LIER_02377 [Lithospermum erythrorhizon]|uniref:DUF4283 domain-containing protein n=1 Tax=Lithospermum erythrorhizon TaxID=34254 RepID=A0AAV3NQB7_LITER